MGNAQIAYPLNSIKRYNTGAAVSVSAATVTSTAGGSSILATGSSASACYALSGSRLGTPTVTDGTSATVWLQVTFDAPVGNSCIIAGSNIPSGATVELYSGTGGSPILFGTFSKATPNNLWVFYDPITAAGLTGWSIKITMSGAQVVEIPFVGFFGFELDELLIDEPGILRGYSMEIVDSTVVMGGGPSGGEWTRENPQAYRQVVKLNAPNGSTLVKDVYDALRSSNFANPVVSIMDVSSLTSYGSCAFGRVSRLTPYGMGGGGPVWSVDFTVENAR